MVALNKTERIQKIIVNILHVAVFALSLSLIIYISYDTFNNIPFLQNKNYIQFQLWVCIVFLLDFFVALVFSKNKWRYFKHHFLFFFVAIPFLNIIDQWDIQFTHEELYFIRFIPLARGAYALAVVVGYASSNRISAMFASYLAIMVSIVYFASLIFFESEHIINPQVPDYASALWWACMNVTTLGAPIVPITTIGKVLCVCLGGLGMMMFPLFTVYITNYVTTHNDSLKEFLRHKAKSNKN